MLPSEAAYREGMQRWQETLRVKHGEEARPFDLVLGGIAALLGDTVQRVANRWHDPLASAHPDQPLSQVIAMMQHVGNRWGTDTTQHYEFNEGLSSRTLPFYLISQLDRLSLDPADPGFIQWRDALIDSEIKRAYPKVRRNTKEYRRLHASVIGQANQRIIAQRSSERTEIMRKVRGRVTELMGHVKRAMGHVGFLRLLAADLVRLGGDHAQLRQGMTELQTRATTFGRALARMRRGDN